MTVWLVACLLVLSTIFFLFKWWSQRCNIKMFQISHNLIDVCCVCMMNKYILV